MFAKLAVVVLTIGACACTLLSLRQARLQAAHELTRAQLRVREADDRLWAMRAEIGRRVMPDQIRQMASALGSFRPMLPLPGDVERRSDYARLTAPPAGPDPAIPAKPAAGPDVRTVSHVERAAPARTIAPEVLSDDSETEQVPAARRASPSPAGNVKAPTKTPLKSSVKAPAKTPNKPVDRRASADKNEKSTKAAKPAPKTAPKSAPKSAKPERREVRADRPERGQ